jgi:uncharacterized protein DUF3606
MEERRIRPGRAPKEVLRVDLNERQDVPYWCEKLNCTERELREAVEQVGPMPSNVEAYLRTRNTRGLENMHPRKGQRYS